MTVIEAVPPAATRVLVACAWLAGLAVTVQPSGPVAAIANVVSVAVPFRSERLNENVLDAGPRSSGKSEVRVTSPPTFASVRMVSGSEVVPCGPVASTRNVEVPVAASLGMSTLRLTSTGLPLVT